MALLPASLDASSNDKTSSDGSSSSAKASQAQASQPTQQKQAPAPVRSVAVPANPAPISNNSKPVVRASTSSPATTQSSSDKAAQIAAIQSQVQTLQKQVTAAQNAGYGANDQIRYDSKGNVAPKTTSQSTNTYSNPPPISSSSSSSKSTAQSSSSRSPGVSTSSSPTISYQSAPSSQPIQQKQASAPTNPAPSSYNSKPVVRTSSSSSPATTQSSSDKAAQIAPIQSQVQTLQKQVTAAQNAGYGANDQIRYDSKGNVAPKATSQSTNTYSSNPAPSSSSTSSSRSTAQSSSRSPGVSTSSSPTISYQSIPASPSIVSTSNGKSASSGYTVQKGDTLANIAASHNMTSAQLLALNPQYKSNPNLIGVGEQMQLTTPKTVGPTVPYVSVGTNPTRQTTAQTTASTKLQSSPYSSSPTFQFTPVSQSTTSSSINTNSGGSSYTVKKGDTLANIAANHNMTSAQLLALNPQYKSNPNLIGAGQEMKFGSPTASIPFVPVSSTYSSGRSSTQAVSLTSSGSQDISYMSTPTHKISKTRDGVFAKSQPDSIYSPVQSSANSEQTNNATSRFTQIQHPVNSHQSGSQDSMASTEVNAYVGPISLDASHSNGISKTTGNQVVESEVCVGLKSGSELHLGPTVGLGADVFSKICYTKTDEFQKVPNPIVLRTSGSTVPFLYHNSETQRFNLKTGVESDGNMGPLGLNGNITESRDIQTGSTTTQIEGNVGTQFGLGGSVGGVGLGFGVFNGISTSKESNPSANGGGAD